MLKTYIKNISFLSLYKECLSTYFLLQFVSTMYLFFFPNLSLWNWYCCWFWDWTLGPSSPISAFLFHLHKIADTLGSQTFWHVSACLCSCVPFLALVILGRWQYAPLNTLVYCTFHMFKNLGDNVSNFILLVYQNSACKHTLLVFLFVTRNPWHRDFYFYTILICLWSLTHLIFHQEKSSWCCDSHSLEVDPVC